VARIVFDIGSHRTFPYKVFGFIGTDESVILSSVTIATYGCHSSKEREADRERDFWGKNIMFGYH